MFFIQQITMKVNIEQYLQLKTSQNNYQIYQINKTDKIDQIDKNTIKSIDSIYNENKKETGYKKELLTNTIQFQCFDNQRPSTYIISPIQSQANNQQINLDDSVQFIQFDQQKQNMNSEFYGLQLKLDYDSFWRRQNIDLSKQQKQKQISQDQDLVYNSKQLNIQDPIEFLILEEENPHEKKYTKIRYKKTVKNVLKAWSTGFCSFVQNPIYKQKLLACFKQHKYNEEFDSLSCEQKIIVYRGFIKDTLQKRDKSNIENFKKIYIMKRFNNINIALINFYFRRIFPSRIDHEMQNQYDQKRNHFHFAFRPLVCLLDPINFSISWGKEYENHQFYENF